MPTTANFSLEYPDDNSSVDIAGHFETLADDVDAAINTRLALTGGTLTGALAGTLTTDASSSTTGAFKTAGGMGIAKALYVGTTLNVTGATTLTGTLNVSGATTLADNLTISKASPVLWVSASSGHNYWYIDRAAGSSALLRMRTGTSSRWAFGVNGTSESGSNAGSNFEIYRYSDAGSAIDAPLSITRSTGLTTLSSLTVSGTTTLSGDLTLTKATPSVIVNASSAAQESVVTYQTGGVDRWKIGKNLAAESGSDGGSNFTVRAYSDAGALLSTPITILRGSGAMTLTGNVTLDRSGGAFNMTAATGNTLNFRFQTSGTNRWSFIKTSEAESGSDAGSNFQLYKYTDGGSGTVNLDINRSTGKWTFRDVGSSAGLELGTSGPRVMSGTGSPEGVVTAPVGSTWIDTAAGLLYWKQTGTGNTGWVKNVTGPTASTDNALARFDGTNGAVQNSGITVDDSGYITSDLTVSKSAPVVTISDSSGSNAANLLVSSPAGFRATVALRSGTSNRWLFRKSSDAESGSNAGSDWEVVGVDDGGSQRVEIRVTRSTGKITFGSVGATAGLELGTSGPRVMSGTGSPEGVVTAPVGSTWIDTAATTGAIKWIKAAGSGSSGWVVEYGDTGWRNLNASLQTGWTGKLLVRRTNSTVTVATANADPLSFAAGAAGTVLTGPPTGFGSTYEAIISARSSADGAAVRPFLWRSGGTAYYYGSTAGGGSLLFSYTTTTAEAWPTSLPGSAA